MVTEFFGSHTEMLHIMSLRKIKFNKKSIRAKERFAESLKIMPVEFSYIETGQEVVE